jgi:hypothetical protein
MPKTFLYLIAAFILISCSGKEKVIGLNEQIHHDDFEYSVLAVEKAGYIGSVKSSGTFYIITFQVENRAKRVEHEWNNSIAYLVEGSGKEYENQPELQKNLQQSRSFLLKDRYVTPAGKTESTILVFEVPAGPKELYLKVRGDLLMGDLFDGGQFKHTMVKIE